jgi:hypothetical protein
LLALKSSRFQNHYIAPRQSTTNETFANSSTCTNAKSLDLLAAIAILVEEPTSEVEKAKGALLTHPSRSDS